MERIQVVRSAQGEWRKWFEWRGAWVVPVERCVSGERYEGRGVLLGKSVSGKCCERAAV